MSGRLIAATTGALLVLLAGCGSDDSAGQTSAPPQPPPTSAGPAKLMTGSPTYDRIVKRGRLVVGIAEAPGLAARDTGGAGYTGFEVEVGKLLAGKLGLTENDVLFKPVPVSQRREAVANEDVDIQLGGITDGSAEPGKLAVTTPYQQTPAGLLARMTAGVTGVDDVRGKPVCVPKDSQALVAIQQAGLSLRVADTLKDCAGQLGSGAVVAVADDSLALHGYASTEPNTYSVATLPGPVTHHDIGVAAKDKVFKSKLGTILAEAARNGEISRRYDATLGAKSATPTTGMTNGYDPSLTPTPTH